MKIKNYVWLAVVIVLTTMAIKVSCMVYTRTHEVNRMHATNNLMAGCSEEWEFELELYENKVHDLENMLKERTDEIVK